MSRNDQEKSNFYSPHVLILATDPSKNNIETAARVYAQMDGEISREEARVVIETIQGAEARNSRSVGENILRLIDVAFDNIRWCMVKTC
jgi:hypothetical protein